MCLNPQTLINEWMWIEMISVNIYVEEKQSRTIVFKYLILGLNTNRRTDGAVIILLSFNETKL